MADQRSIHEERAKALRQAYRLTFGGEDRLVHQTTVLEHLKRICHYDKSIVEPAYTKAGSVDPMALAVMEGRRQVIIAILEQLTITEAQIAQLSGRTAKMEESA
jgi:hypothetical protein